MLLTVNLKAQQYRFNTVQKYNQKNETYETVSKGTVLVNVNESTKRIYITDSITKKKSTFYIRRHSSPNGFNIYDCKDSTNWFGCSIEFTETKKENYLIVDYDNKDWYLYKK